MAKKIPSEERVIAHSVTLFQKAVKEIVPSVDKLEQVAKSKNVKQLSGVQEKLKKAVAKEVTSKVSETIEKVSYKAMKDEVARLQKMGVIVNPEIVNQLQKKFTEKFMKKKFLGKTTAQRIATYSTKSSNGIAIAIKEVKKKGVDPDKIRRIRNQHIGKAEGFSTARTGKVIVHSESYRARAESILELAEAISAKFVRWVTRGDNKVCAKCIEYSTGTTVSKKEAGGIDRAGLYHIDDIPVRHPLCRCTFNIVVGDEGLVKPVKAKTIVTTTTRKKTKAKRNIQKITKTRKTKKRVVTNLSKAKKSKSERKKKKL